ncbi:MAG: hypothetical protein H6577_06360 [Lewinellaceae bacterium]|nr:hypothetical protein [Saprospiraceae bacterium]MCB9337731.1 hypothetical protein [Lewinellaceae bacterium]
MRLKHFDQIEAYEAGTVSSAERLAFEAKLETDAALQREYEVFQAAKKVALLFAFEQLKSEIKEMQPERAGGIFYSKEPKISKSLLFKYFSHTSAGLPLSLAIAPRRGHNAWVSSTSTTVDLSIQFSKWRQMNFVKGYNDSFREATARTAGEAVNYAELEFKRGHSLLRSRRPREAAAAFRKVLQSGKTAWAESARWFLALSLLSFGQNDEARAILQNVARADTGSYRPLAKELLSKIATGKHQ